MAINPSSGLGQDFFTRANGSGQSTGTINSRGLFGPLTTLAQQQGTLPSTTPPIPITQTAPLTLSSAIFQPLPKPINPVITQEAPKKPGQAAREQAQEAAAKAREAGQLQGQIAREQAQETAANARAEGLRFGELAREQAQAGNNLNILA